MTFYSSENLSLLPIPLRLANETRFSTSHPPSYLSGPPSFTRPHHSRPSCDALYCSHAHFTLGFVLHVLCVVFLISSLSFGSFCLRLVVFFIFEELYWKPVFYSPPFSPRMIYNFMDFLAVAFVGLTCWTTVSFRLFMSVV